MSVLSPAGPTQSPSPSAPETLAASRVRGVYTVTGLDPSCEEKLAQRLYDLGFRAGVPVECIRKAPLGSPIMFRVCDTDICLRAHQAKLIHATLGKPTAETGA